MSEDINKITSIYNQIKDSTDQQFVKDKSEQLKNILSFINVQEISQDDLSKIQIILGNIIESTVDNGLLNPSDIQEAKQKLTQFDNTIESQQKQAGTNSKIALGLAAILLTCSSLFADIAKKSNENKEGAKTQQNVLQKNIFSYTLTIHYIKFYQGTVKGDYTDASGKVHKNVHILHDDNKGAKRPRKWDGKISTTKFIQNCVGTAQIGYGDTDFQLCKKGFLTQEQASQALLHKVAKMFKKNRKIVGQDAFSSLTTKQQACLIALWYNLGSARATPKLVKNLQFAFNPSLDRSRNPKNKKTLLTRQQYLSRAANQFLDCNKIDDKENEGLTRRVNSLSYLFLQDVKK